MPTQKQLKQLVARRHPLYKEMVSHWNFLESSYLGGRQWFPTNIFRYHKEGDEEYASRVKRAYRFNHTREVVDLVNKYLFRGKISRRITDAPPAVVEFWQRSTFKGMNIDELMMAASVKSSTTGRYWMIIDSTSTNTVVSQADEPENSIYAYLVSPQQVLDLSYDDQGELNWILVEERYREDEDPFIEDAGVAVRYRLWGRDSWMLLKEDETKGGNKKIVVVGQGTHNLGVVNAVPIDNSMTTDRWDCAALIADIAYLDRACANYASNLDAVIQDQSFSQLAMPAQNVLPGEDMYNKLLEMGTKRIFLYDSEGGEGPHFISPDPRQANLIINAVQTLINEIYHSVGLAGERTKQDNSKGIDNSSGVAKAVDFERVTALLRSKAEALEVAEHRIVKVVCAWAGIEPPNPEELVSYPETFDVTDLDTEMDVAIKLSLLPGPELVRGEQMKRLTEYLFPSMGETERNAFHADITKWQSKLGEVVVGENRSTQADDMRNRLKEESTRDREGAGATQSQSKEQQTTG